MKTRVELDPQVANLLRSLAPDPRKQLRAALRGLEEERGDLKAFASSKFSAARRLARPKSCLRKDRRIQPQQLQPYRLRRGRTYSDRSNVGGSFCRVKS